MWHDWPRNIAVGGFWSFQEYAVYKSKTTPPDASTTLHSVASERKPCTLHHATVGTDGLVKHSERWPSSCRSIVPLEVCSHRNRRPICPHACPPRNPTLLPSLRNATPDHSKLNSSPTWPTLPRQLHPRIPQHPPALPFGFHLSRQSSASYYAATTASKTTPGTAAGTTTSAASSPPDTTLPHSSAATYRPDTIYSHPSYTAHLPCCG